jgi:flagellar biosynthetic protein FlhB
MAEQTGQERTEQATPKRLRESREKGQVPRSKELNSMALLMAAGGGFLLMGENILIGLSEVLKKGLQIKNIQQMDGTGIVGVLADTALESLLLIAPLFVLLTVVVIMKVWGEYLP